jgi:hypothetical protein
MDRDEYRDEDGPSDAYWRRRVITLALGFGLLGVIAWSFSGGGGKASTDMMPAAALGTAIPGGTAIPLGTPLPGLPGKPAASGVPASPSPSPSPLPATQRPTAGPGGAARAAASTSGPDSPATSLSGQCAPGSLVLSLFTDRPSYGPGEYPTFEVYAVSTSAGSCSFDPGQLQAIVMASGRIVWDSADCSRGSDARPAELARGVPAQASIVWNRAITLPGCQVLASSARAGSYQVQARTATAASPVRDFRLTG